MVQSLSFSFVLSLLVSLSPLNCSLLCELQREERGRDRDATLLLIIRTKLCAAGLVMGFYFLVWRIDTVLIDGYVLSFNWMHGHSFSLPDYDHTPASPHSSCPFTPSIRSQPRSYFFLPRYTHRRYTSPPIPMHALPIDTQLVPRGSWSDMIAAHGSILPFLHHATHI